MSGKQAKLVRQKARDVKNTLRVKRERERNSKYVELRGKKHRMLVEGSQIGMPVIMALLSLEDERVDKVLLAYGVKVYDYRNRLVWPAPEEDPQAGKQDA